MMRPPVKPRPANRVLKNGVGSSQTILLVRRGRTIGMCSLDARSEGQSGCSPEGEVGKTRRPSPGQMARLGVPVGGRVRRLCAVEDQAAPIPEEVTSKLGGSMYIVRCAQ